MNVEIDVSTILIYTLFFFLLIKKGTRMMELALLLEKKVIMLKNDALRTFQIALASTASGHLQELLEGAFGYPESQASIERNKQLEEIQQQLPANRQDTEPVAVVEPTTESANPDTDPARNIGDITPQPGEELDKDIECPRLLNNVITLNPLKSYQI